MLNSTEKNILKMILQEALVDIDSLIDDATNDSDKAELTEESETLKSVISKLDL